MPTSDEPRAAPLPGAYAGHQMIELEWKALTEGSTKLLTYDYCKQLGARLSRSASNVLGLVLRTTMPMQ